MVPASASKDGTLKARFCSQFRLSAISSSLAHVGIDLGPEDIKLKTNLPGHTDEVHCVDFVADKAANGGSKPGVEKAGSRQSLFSFRWVRTDLTCSVGRIRCWGV